MSVKNDFPFSAKVYRQSSTDLAQLNLSDAELEVHFETIGKSERRLFALTDTTSEYLSMRWLRGNGIEIGAGGSPTPLFGNSNIVYADIEGGEGIFDAENVTIKYSIDKPAPLELCGQFDFAVLSHVLEHSDGVIAALKNLFNLLKPDGIAYITVPDRRFLLDAEWMPEFPIEHHLDEARYPGMYDRSHDQEALASLRRHEEISNPSGDQQVFHDPSLTDGKKSQHPDFRLLLAQASHDNPYRFAVHKHTYSLDGWCKLMNSVQPILGNVFEIEEVRYGTERQDCHFILRKKVDRALNAAEYQGKKVTVGISYYHNPQLVDKIEKVLIDLISSPKVFAVILINDSPGDVLLERRLGALLSDKKLKIIKNKKNLGYTKSINQAYASAKASKTHLACINSDVDFNIDVLDELTEILGSDRQIGFAFPRADSDPLFGLTGVLATSGMARKLLPRYQFTPTAVGYFFVVASSVVDRFEGFDELFSPGYEEENDLVLRAGGLGFRAVVANHVLIQHATSTSFSSHTAVLKEKHHRLLLNRHPYFTDLVKNYEISQANALYQVFNRLHHLDDLIVDCYDYPPVLNGTTIYARDLIGALNRVNADTSRVITVLIREDVYQILGLQKHSRLRFCHDPIWLRPHFCLLRVAQPFESNAFDRALNNSVCSVNIFFDTIAQDISSLRNENTEAIWEDLTKIYRNVVFISGASKRAFAARYPTRGAALHVIHPSLDIADYGPSVLTKVDISDAKILIVGNKFPHKDIEHTINVLLGSNKLSDLKFNALSDSLLKPSARLEIFKSGGLLQDAITRLYSTCKLVVYPSYYEGFGLPLMEALHFCRPVIARHAPLYEELKELLGPISSNIYLYNTEQELIELLLTPPTWIELKASSPFNWDEAARMILSVVDNSISAFDFEQRKDARSSVFSRRYGPDFPVFSSAAVDLHATSAAAQLEDKLVNAQRNFPFAYRVARYIYRRMLK